MLIERLIVTILLVPLGIGVIALGGPVYAVVVTAIMGLAAWEYWRMFAAIDFAPSRVLVIGGAVALNLARAFLGFTFSDLILAFLVLAAITVHLVAYERGRERAGVDFGITVGGILYLGWLGAYFISLRDQPDGKWWVLLVLPAIWLADSGAYSIGRRWGRHKMAPRLSPKKSWEGYAGGIVAGVIAGALLAALWGLVAPSMAIWKGALVGLVVSVITPLGDFGESMFKRQAGMKDSSNIIPGHGGIFDRIDSWLWGAVIGYYLIAYWLG